MCENTRKMLSLLMAAVMLISMLPMGVSAQVQAPEEESALETVTPEADALVPLEQLKPVTDTIPETTLQTDGTATPLVLNTPQSAVISTGGEIVRFSFTPEVSATYIFSSNTSLDPYGYLLDENGNQLVSDDDSGSEFNFRIQYSLTAGITYTLCVKLCDSGRTGSFPVVVERSPLVSLSFSPVSLIEGTECSLNTVRDSEGNIVQYYYYDARRVLSNSTITATFVDGTVVTGTNNYFEYKGEQYRLSVWPGTQDNENQWTAGNTYTVYGSVGGFTAECPVTIIPSPLKSISFTPIQIRENTLGHNTSDGPGGQAYYFYEPYQMLQKSTYTAAFADGTSVTGNGGTLEYNGASYEMYYSAPQSYDTQWTVNGTYSITVSIMGQTVQVPVTITTLPLESVTFAPISVTEGSCGNYITEGDIEYYHYEPWTLMYKSTFTATFTDGTVITDINNGFNYDGVWLSFNYTTNQSATNQWVAGNTYYVDISVGGKTAQIPVTITPSPLQSITYNPVTVFEGTCGSMATGWDPVTQSNQEYFRYDLSDVMRNTNYTAVFANGTTQGGSGNNSLYYDGSWYYPQFTDNQRYDNQWTVGNTYYITARIMGKQVVVPVTIAPSPVVSFTVKPITLVERLHGYETETGGNSWYRYSWSNKLNYTLTLNDGTVLEGSYGNGLWYQDKWYSLYYPDDQSYQNQWTPGNTYTGTAKIMGATAQVPITIVESPVASVTFAPIILEEYKDGYWRSWEGYFDYDWQEKCSYAVTFKDGAVLQASGWNSVYYDGERYGITSCCDNQGSQNPWLKDNTYLVQVYFMGMCYDVPVTICSKTEDNGYTYFVQDGKAIINSCTMQTEILQIPETIDGYPVTGIISLGEAIKYALEIRIPDSVTMLSGTFLEQEDYGYYTIPLKKLTLGSGIVSLSPSMLYYARNLEYIDVAEANPHLCSIDGAVYNKAVTVLVAYPPAKTDLHMMPDSVTNADILFNIESWRADMYANVDVQFGAGIADYKVVDGIIYNPDMTTIIKATSAATGSYVMPDTVTGINAYAFAGSNLTSITLAPSVTAITYSSFDGATALEELTIPSAVKQIGHAGFYSCINLKRINIFDLDAWCQISFSENPLSVAHDLYLNGELVKDLVIPETVAEGVYSTNKINQWAFMGGSFETVTIPSRIETIGYDAFFRCENLEAVYITDMQAWCNVEFETPESNPLYYAQDLYLNGELVKDLVLPETVVDRVYGEQVGAMVYGTNQYTFYNASIESVTVPRKLVRIHEDAFCGCENLNRVNISDLAAWMNIEFDSPQSNPLYHGRNLYLNGEKITDLVLQRAVISNDPFGSRYVCGVRDYTFYNIDIKTLTVPDFVYSIGQEAFYGSSVEEIIFADGYLDHIGYSAFEGSGVKSLVLPDSMESIQPRAFADCVALQDVTFGSELKTITYEAFQGSGVRAIELPDSLTYLGGQVFENCTDLVYVDLGNQINCIPYSCFANTGLKSITLPKQIELIEAGAFQDSLLTEVNFECENVVVLGDAFFNCPVDEFDLKGLTMVDWQSFAGTGAAQIKIPHTVTGISYRSFAFNQNLVSVTIPETVEGVAENAFEGCYNLSHVLYTGTSEQWENLGTSSPELNAATLHCQANGNEVAITQTCTTVTYCCSICELTETVRKGMATHTFDENEICTICGFQGYWEYEVDEIAETVTIVNYTGPETDVVVPDKIEGMPVTAFTRDTFAYNRKLRSVILPDGITEIPDEAFSYCLSLRTVTVGDSVTTVGDKAFYRCEILRTLHLPDTVERIGDYAFEVTDLYDFKIPKGVKYIGEGAFIRCSIAEAEIPAGVTEISYCAFEYSNLQNVTIPDTVTTIGYYAFRGCRFQEITIPASVQEIGPGSFNLDTLETVIFQGNKPEMVGAFTNAGIIAFYPAADRTWSDIPADNNQWIACKTPKITKQPVTAVVESGETATVAVEAYGQRLSYQWYYAAPGVKKFTAVGGDSVELSMEITKENTGGRAYCIVTDVLGQSMRTDTVFLKVPARANGIRLKQLPYTREYDMRQELRTRGLEVAITYDDNSEETVLDYAVTGYDPNVSGEQTITVTFGGYTATFTVTVNAEKLNFANTEEKIEISAPEGAVDSDVELVVEKVYHEESLPELPVIPEVIQENEAVIFDITLEQEGQAVQPADTVQVSIPVPEHMESKRCKVYHIDDNGHAEDMRAHYKDGRMVFDTNHFSYYAVVEVTGVTVSGTVKGAGDLSGTLVKLISGGEVLETVVTSQNGNYQFTDVVANDYIIEAVQEGLPAKQAEVTVLDRDLIQDILMAILGDIDGNMDVTTDDVIQLLLHVGMPDLFHLDTIGDFTGDGEVTTDDVILLLLHVGMPDLFPLEHKG